MRVFALDDMEERLDFFRHKFRDCELVTAKTAQEAIEILKEGLDYDLITLDHDLGERIFVDSNDENTGYQVAKFLQDKIIKCPIVIHSMNYGGARAMQSCLPLAKHVPFCFISQCHT
jgi:CheY-like chemotaxis protein